MKFAMLAASAMLVAALPNPSAAQEPGQPRTPPEPQLQETIHPLFQRALPNVPGKALIAAEVLFPPGAASPPHRHPPSAFLYAYVVSGAIISAVDDKRPRVYRAGDSWQEAPGAHHTVTRNPSKTEPTKLLVIFIVDPDEHQLVVPDPK
jgi:quercetin dioxygenase-like cupin family protein